MWVVALCTRNVTSLTDFPSGDVSFLGKIALTGLWLV